MRTKKNQSTSPGIFDGPWHLIAGGPMDGIVVHYFGAYDQELGFNYSIPGMLTLAPMYVHAGAMIKITREQARDIEAGRNAMPKIGR